MNKIDVRAGRNHFKARSCFDTMIFKKSPEAHHVAEGDVKDQIESVIYPDGKTVIDKLR